MMRFYWDKTMRERQPAVYIMASRRNGTLYTGVTSNLAQRVWRHREGLGGFSGRYDCGMLMWFEIHATMNLPLRGKSNLKLAAARRNWR